AGSEEEAEDAEAEADAEGSLLDELPLRPAAPAARAQSLPLVAEPSQEPPEEQAEDDPPPAKKVPTPKTAKGKFPLPPGSILDELKSDVGVDKSRLFEKAKILQNKCGEFGVLGNVVEIHPGPVVTTYEFKPDAGIKYSKVVGLADDLALALEAESIRIDRMSGRGT